MDPAEPTHSRGVELPRPLLAGALTETAEAARAPTLAQLHAEHARFVWRSLSRLGVREPDLPDMLQEVFVVVHRRLHTFDPARAKASTWLFGICRRVASGYRRRAHLRREEPFSEVPERVASGPGPEEGAALKQAARALGRILDEMNVDQRAAFVMYELEGIDCAVIADTFGVPVGTIYSRLHAARAIFARSLARLGAAERREVGR